MMQEGWDALDGADSGDGTSGEGKALHAFPGASQGLRCRFCGSAMTPNGTRRGSPQKFCVGKPCRRVFWQQARKVGGQVLRRRRARAIRPASPHLDAASRKILALLIAAGSAATGIPIPNRAPRWVTKEQRRLAKSDDPARIPEGQG